MKPIGYWFSHLHGLLESSFEALLGAEGLTRRHWQVLNTIAEGARGRDEVDTALAPFREHMAPLVDELVNRGWVSSGEPFELTEQGRSAHQRILGLVRVHRQQITEGISNDDFRTTHRVLERMAANLGE